MAHRTVIPGQFAERGQAQITALLVDETGAVLGFATVTTLTLTLYDKRSDAVINSRDGDDIKASLDVNGNIDLRLAPTDMVITDSAREKERHVALFKWTVGAIGGNHEIEFTVVNQNRIP